MTNTIYFSEDRLHVESLAVSDIVQAFGTPTYVYSATKIEAAYQHFVSAFADRDIMVCYAVKANSNLGVLGLLADQGAGFDIVSQGELERVIRAGGDPRRVVFSGVGKQDPEIARALQAGIACFNIESRSELERIAQIAAPLSISAPISVRINPDVDPMTHPYISTGLKENKFGVDIETAREIYRRAKELPWISIKGVDCHIGSQITDLAPFKACVQKVAGFVDELASEGIELEHIDLGGGIGVSYNGESVIDVRDYANAICEILKDYPQRLVFEPGRTLVADAGLLLCRVVTLKENEGKHFAVVDAAMNDLLRPALYGAYQRIEPIAQLPRKEQVYDVVGPVCESGDFLAKERRLAIAEDDILAIHSCGAYAFVMSSNYNTRGRAAEVLVKGETMQCVRDRESIEDQLRLERLFSV